MSKGRKKEKKKIKKSIPPSSYLIVPHYFLSFPEQVDIVRRATKTKKRYTPLSFAFLLGLLVLLLLFTSTFAF